MSLEETKDWSQLIFLKNLLPRKYKVSQLKNSKSNSVSTACQTALNLEKQLMGLKATSWTVWA
jgi:hypothetical protein